MAKATAAIWMRGWASTRRGLVLLLSRYCKRSRKRHAKVRGRLFTFLDNIEIAAYNNSGEHCVAAHRDLPKGDGRPPIGMRADIHVELSRYANVKISRKESAWR